MRPRPLPERAMRVGRAPPLDEVDAAMRSHAPFDGDGHAGDDVPSLRPRRTWSRLRREAAHDRGASGRHTSTGHAAMRIGRAHAAGTLPRRAAIDLLGEPRRPNLMSDAEWGVLRPAVEAARRP